MPGAYAHVSSHSPHTHGHSHHRTTHPAHASHVHHNAHHGAYSQNRARGPKAVRLCLVSGVFDDSQSLTQHGPSSSHLTALKSQFSRRTEL
nr:hypothetical protein L203_04233 [Cryptococcus depauperatus CBS 7841]